MKIKITLAVLVTLITVSNSVFLPAANAAAISSTSYSSNLIDQGIQLTQVETSLMKSHETIIITTQTGRYINLGKDYFSKTENQGVSISSTLGQCVTDNVGCWSEDKDVYLPLLIKASSLGARNSLVSDIERFNKANGWDIALGVAGLVAAVSASVLIVATLPVTVPVVVITVATVATRVATAGAGFIAACRGLTGGCR